MFEPPRWSDDGPPHVAGLLGSGGWIFFVCSPVGQLGRQTVTNHRPEKNGAQGLNRTADTVIFSHVLYQLSYLGIKDRRL